MHRSRAAKRLALLTLLFFVAIIGPFFVLHTRSYPATVVEGNSMLPALHTGDLVIFRGLLRGEIVPNGTIIIFQNIANGNPILDQITRPVVIHRVIDVFAQSDGVYYTTKGDNNPSPDGAPVRSDRILGVSVIVIPKAGSIALFLQSPQGLVMALAIMLTTNQGINARRTKQQILQKLSLSGNNDPAERQEVHCICEACLGKYQ